MGMIGLESKRFGVRWQNPEGVATPLSQGRSLPYAIARAKAVSSLRFATALQDAGALFALA
jgi:hypothetical protein